MSFGRFNTQVPHLALHEVTLRPLKKAREPWDAAMGTPGLHGFALRLGPGFLDRSQGIAENSLRVIEQPPVNSSWLFQESLKHNHRGFEGRSREHTPAGSSRGLPRSPGDPDPGCIRYHASGLPKP